MALRFRKSFKLAPGIRMNLSASGTSWSVGPRGATVGIGKRGTYLNTGIPGTGLSARQRIGGMNPMPRGQGQAVLESLPITVGVTDNGTIMFRDRGGDELPEQLIRTAKRQHGEAIKQLIQSKCDEINREIDSIGEIHNYTPSPSEKPVFIGEVYEEPRPVIPAPKKLGFILSLFKSQREKIEAQNRVALSDYQVRLSQWEGRERKHRAKEERRRALVEELIYIDPEAMSEYLEGSLQEIVWPRETSVSTEILANGRAVFIDVDLPEIEDMPSKKAVVSANGYKLSVKDLSAASVQKLYMQHVHGIAFRIAGEAFSSLPKADEVILSGYSQRPNKATGQVSDEYLLSVRIRRHAWSEISFDNLESIDVVESLARFELKRSMSKTGIFKSVEPYSPADINIGDD